MGVTGEYDHSSYDKHRGSLTIFSDDNYPDGVFYEQCIVRLSEIEGFLLQETNLPSRQDRGEPARATMPNVGLER